MHDVTTAPEVMKGVIDGHRADAELIGEFHASVHGGLGDRLAEFVVAVPFFACCEMGGEFFDFGFGLATADFGAEHGVEVQGFDSVVCADSVPGCHSAPVGCGIGFLRVEAAGLVGGGDEPVMVFDGEKGIGRHSAGGG